MVNIGQLSSINDKSGKTPYVFQIVSEETYNKTKKFLEKNNLDSGYAVQYPDAYYVFVGAYDNGKFKTIPEINAEIGVSVSKSSVNEFNAIFDAAIKTAKVPERQAQLIENATKGGSNYFTLATTAAAVTQGSSGSVALGAVEPTAATTEATTEAPAAAVIVSDPTAAESPPLNGFPDNTLNILFDGQQKVIEGLGVIGTDSAGNKVVNQTALDNLSADEREIYDAAVRIQNSISVERARRNAPDQVCNTKQTSKGWSYENPSKCEEYLNSVALQEAIQRYKKDKELNSAIFV